jgi:protein kinase A
MRGGTLDIRSHKWFEDMDWMSLYGQKLPPPYTPKIRGPGDATNFDEYNEEPIQYSTIDKYAKEFEQF